MEPTSVALFQAVKQGDEDRARDLLDSGVSIEARGYATQLTPLMEAAMSRQVGMARLLVSRGADVNAVNVDGRTALMTAALCGSTQIVQLLKEAGADVSLSDNGNQQARDYAHTGMHFDLVPLLQERPPIDHMMEALVAATQGVSLTAESAPGVFATLNSDVLTVLFELACPTFGLTSLANLSCSCHWMHEKLRPYLGILNDQTKTLNGDNAMPLYAWFAKHEREMWDTEGALELIDNLSEAELRKLSRQAHNVDPRLALWWLHRQAVRNWGVGD